MKESAARTMLAAICSLELTLSQVRGLHLPKGDTRWCEICRETFPCKTYTIALGDPVSAMR